MEVLGVYLRGLAAVFPLPVAGCGQPAATSPGGGGKDGRIVMRPYTSETRTATPAQGAIP